MVISFGNVLNRNKTLVLSLLLIGSIITISAIQMQPASASSCTAGATPATLDCTIAGPSAGNVISLRDISDTSNVTSTTTISLDKSIFHSGDRVQLTLTDVYANLDSSVMDTTKVRLTSTSDPVGIPLVVTETGIATSTFVGTFTVTSGPSSGTALHTNIGDKIQVGYTPVPVYSSRFQLTFDNGGAVPGNATVNDFDFSSGEDIGQGFAAVIEGSNFTLSPVANLNLGSTEHVVLSYANSVFGCPVSGLTGCNENGLSLWISPPTASPFHTFVMIASGNPADGVPPVVLDPVAKTISYDVDLTSIDGSTTGSWLFVLGFNGGGPGGAGGGIVNAGLILDALAGLGAPAENVPVPPSFGGGINHYTDGLTLTQGKTTTTWDTSKYNQEIPKQVFTAGDKINMTFKTYDGYNPKAVIHMGLYIIPRGKDMITPNSIASIVYDKNSPLEVNDPNHILSKVSANMTSNGKYQYTQFLFTPTKSYDKMSFLARAWNDRLMTTDVRVHDEIIVPPSPKALPTGVIQYNTLSDLQDAIEKDGFYKPTVLAHIHGTNEVFDSTQGGQVYWLYDTINHSVKLIIADKNGTEVGSQQSILRPVAPQEKPDYGFMTFTTKQLNRQDVNQEQDACKKEEEKAMKVAQENGLVVQRRW